jgi:hypothetical protein
MLDRGDSSIECLIEETAKHSRWLSPLSSIQGFCLLYQAFKAAVSSIKHSRWLSPLSNIQGFCLLYQTFKVAVGGSILGCLIEESDTLNV